MRPVGAGAFITLVVAGLWIGIFLVYRFPVSGDVVLFYRPQARAAMSGAVPTVNFQSAYMPLFPYLIGVVDAICSSDLSIPCFLAACFLTSGLLLPTLFESPGVPSRTAWTLASVGILNGASWALALGFQQDESLLLLFVVLASILILRGRTAVAGAVLALGLLATKILFLLPAAILAWLCPEPRRLSRAAAVTFLSVAAAFVWLGFNPFKMLGGEAHQWIGPSLTDLIGVWPTAHEAFSRHGWLIQAAVATGCLVSIFLMRRSDENPEGITLVRGITAVWLVFLLISPKSLPAYRLLILPLLPVLAERSQAWRRWLVVLYCVYCTLLPVESMLREDWINQAYPDYLVGHRTDSHSMIALLVLVAMDATIVVSELIWLALCIRVGGRDRAIPRVS
jgi:hypothetical protein